MKSYKKLNSAILLLVLLLLLAHNASAAICTGTTTGRLQVENARPFNDKGSSMTFYAYYIDVNGTAIHDNNTNVTVRFANTTYAMTNLSTKWSLTVTSNNTEDVDFLVNATSTDYNCLTISFTSRWRTPFYVYIDLYKQPFNQSGQVAEPARYANDFQYVVMVNNNGKNTLDMATWAFNRGTDNLFNTLFGWALDSNSQDLNVDPPDHNIYFWGKYSNGEALVKLYEGGNYSVYVMNNKIQYPNNYFWEFERPSVNEEVAYMGNVIDRLKVYNATNVTGTYATYNNTVYNIFVTKFEANTYYAIMNIGIILIAVTLFIIGLVIVVQLTQNSHNAGSIIVYYLLIGGAAVLSVVFYVQ